MITIRKAQGDDFEGVYPLLLEFKNPQLTKEDWRRLFIDHTGLQNGQFGWVLVDGDVIVGFVGTIFSERIIRGKAVRICNMSSWIVKPKYRSHSLALHAKAIADRSLTVTSLSPSPHTQTLLKMQGFTLMDKSERIILPVVTPRTMLDHCEILTRADAVKRALTGESSRFFLDHQLPFNHHILVRSRDADCYVMMNRTLKTIRGNWRIPFVRVHHISAPDVFVRHLDKLVVRVAASFKAVAMIVEERMLKGAVPWHSLKRPGGERKGAFRSKSIDAEDIDGLYTEAVLLNF